MAGVLRTRRGRRFLVWLPSVTVGLFFLFHIETLGVLSHITKKGVTQDSDYVVTVPLHWMIRYQAEDSNNSQWLVAGRGFARGWNDSGHRWYLLPISHIEVHSLPSGASVTDFLGRHGGCNYGLQRRITSYSSRPLAGGEARCVEYRRVACRQDSPESGPNARFTWARCLIQAQESTSSVEASFVGDASMLPEFYLFVTKNVAATNRKTAKASR